MLVAGSSGRFSSIAAAAGHGSGTFAAGLAACKEHRLGAAEEKEIRARVAAGEGPRRRCDVSCAALPHVPVSPATEDDLERLARHEAYLAWLKSSPSKAAAAIAPLASLSPGLAILLGPGATAEPVPVPVLCHCCAAAVATFVLLLSLCHCCWARLGYFAAGLAGAKVNRLEAGELKEITARVAAGEGPRRRSLRSAQVS